MKWVKCYLITLVELFDDKILDHRIPWLCDRIVESSWWIWYDVGGVQTATRWGKKP